MIEPHPITAQPLFVGAFVSLLRTSRKNANRSNFGDLRGDVNKGASRRRGAREFSRRDSRGKPEVS
jgi:hypothetical protein